MRRHLTQRPKRLRWLSRVVVLFVLIGLIVLLAGYQIGPENVPLFALAQYVPFPAFLLPALAALALSLTLEWPWRIAAAVGVLLVVTVVMGLEVPRRELGTGRIRVMTYNIEAFVANRQPDRFKQIALEVARHNPDIVVLQDARDLESDRQAADAIFGDRAQIFSFGQYVVASRFPLRDCGQREMPFRQQTHTYLSCVVAAYGTEFDLITAHFMTPRSGLAAVRWEPFRGLAEWRQNVSDRMTQAERIASDLRGRRRPVIVAGDLNAPDTSLALRVLLDTGLRDAFAVAGSGYGYTWGHSLRFHFSFLRLDHILVGPEFGVADCFAGGAFGSDHRPVVADLFVARGNRVRGR